MNKTLSRTAFGILLALSSQMAAVAANLDVTFTANLRETTCDMKIEGGTGNGATNTIPIGVNDKLSLSDITGGTSAATTTFKLKIAECPSSLTGLKTTVSGSVSSDVDTGIANSAAAPLASYVAVTIARASAPQTPFIINSTNDAERLVWTSGEISSKEVQLIARLVETQPGLATTGNFSAAATFNFEYQ